MSCRILALHAHPDDLELQCAGTLLRLKERGCEIVMATMTAGDKGSAELGCEEIAAIRKAEAAKSAALLGADYLCLGFRDLEICFDNESRRIVIETLRKTRPQLVFTAPPVDYMADHEETSRLVRDACFTAAVPNYATHQWDPAPPTTRIPHLYYVDPIGGIDYYGEPIEPHLIFDVSEVFERKLELLACHASQREWLRRQHGIDEYLDGCRRFGEERGRVIGVAYGEGFRQHKGHPFPSDDLLTALLE
jgi:LmbE family N-acetylglucosaminyl deacetylase